MTETASEHLDEHFDEFLALRDELDGILGETPQTDAEVANHLDVLKRLVRHMADNDSALNQVRLGSPDEPLP